MSVKEPSLTASLVDAQTGLVAKVTGKLQVTLPKALADRCGIRVGDELDVRGVGRSIQLERRSASGASARHADRLTHFDAATRRQRARQAARRAGASSRSRGWTREELYRRGRTR